MVVGSAYPVLDQEAGSALRVFTMLMGYQGWFAVRWKGSPRGRGRNSLTQGGTISGEAAGEEGWGCKDPEKGGWGAGEG